MPRKSLVCFLAILFALALGINRAFSEDTYYKEIKTLSTIIHRVLNNYVTDLDEEQKQQLFEGAYRGALSTLDPYSQYFNQTQNESFSADTEGEFGGLGIEISVQDGILTVISPIRGTPAYEEGIMAGDMILKIDGESTERITLEQALGVLRGKPGTPVTLTVRHLGSPVDKEITVTRAIIKPASVEAEMLTTDTGIGYMRVTSFTNKVMDDLTQSAEDLRSQGMRALVLDLRQNPGGLLDKAVEMCDMFISEGVIVSVRGRQKEVAESFSAKKGDALESIPMVLLVDEGSASASEIVAGALRDHKRALLVGARTYGKGSVQKVFPLTNGEAIKLTTARYYTPADKPILDRMGIMPDVYVPMTRDHLIALRNQEREDKLRGRYKITDLIEDPPEELAPAAPKEETDGDTPEEETDGDKPEDEEQNGRRGRILDFQLKAAVRMLEWQMAGVAQAPAAD